jgi:putative hemolysin
MLSTLLILFILFFIASALFSGAESALGSISRDSMERFAENGIPGASKLLRIFSNRRRFAIMLITGRVIACSGGTVVLAAFFFIEPVFTGSLLFLNGFIAAAVSTVFFAISEAVVSKIVSVGEYENRVSRFSGFLFIAYILLFPLTFPIVLSMSLLRKSNELEKEEDFIELMKSESESGVIKQDEKEMIESIFEFSDTTVREIMVPRIDVVAVERNITQSELVDIFNSEGHSRIPVYDGRIDNIIGLIYAKDLLTHISMNGSEKFDVTSIMREPYFVPESKKTSDLLKEFKKMKIHLGIVVDEYGGTAGIIALEDLIEEIVGEINDEYDEEKKDFVWLSDTTVLMDAGLGIGGVNEVLRTDIASEDFDTLGGFIYHSLGFIPEGGEEINLGHFTFKIKEIKGNRISKILVTVNEPESEDKKDQKGAD